MEALDTLREPIAESIATAQMSLPPTLADGRTPQRGTEAARIARMLTDLTPNDQGERRAALTLAKLKPRTGASARPPGWAAG